MVMTELLDIFIMIMTLIDDYTEFGIRYIVPNTETVLGTLFQDLGIRYIIPNTVFRY